MGCESSLTPIPFLLHANPYLVALTATPLRHISLSLLTSTDIVNWIGFLVLMKSPEWGKFVNYMGIRDDH